MQWWLAYLALGSFVGFFAGLLGIGGGMTIVPVLSFLFSAQHFAPGHILHLALGTGMASILFTSLSSLRAHHLHGAVKWPVVRAIAPGIVAGTLTGTALASLIPSRYLSAFFAAFVYYAATSMLFTVKPKASRELPGRAGMFLAGGVIGGISSWLAAGGAVLTIPFLTFCNVRVHDAIGTSAAIGFPIAAAGTLGYILTGLGQEGLPLYSLGFVYLPALAWLVLGSMATAPLGARMAHRLRVKPLKLIFAVFLYVLATKMLINLF